MPVIKIPGSAYKFFFYSNERNEPAHVSRAGREAKFWICPAAIAGNWGFAAHELNNIEKLVMEHESEIERVWNEHFPK